MRARRREDLGLLKGWKKVAHKIAMFLLLPFRKPLITLAVLACLYIAPIFVAKVAPKDVHIWYKDKIVAFYNEAKLEISSKIKTVDLDTDKTAPSKPNEKLIQMPSKRTENMRRQIFEKAKSDPQAVDILKQREFINPNLEYVEEEVVLPTRANQEAQVIKVSTEAAKVRKNLALRYLDTPEELSGTAAVINSNSVQVNGVFVFLYGIYSNPSSIEGVKAESLLRKTIGNKAIRCSIIAYTKQDVATGLCYVGPQSLNQMLVNEGLSKNVAL